MTFPNLDDDEYGSNPGPTPDDIDADTLNDITIDHIEETGGEVGPKPEE